MDAGAVEEVRREADDRFEEVLLQQTLANLPLRAAAEQDAVRHDDAEPAGGVQHRHHVLDERQVALGLRRDAEPEAPEAVAFGHVAAPLVEAERRIGDHPVVEQKLSLIDKFRVPDGVALLDPGVGSPWSSMFILQMAQVPRFFSWPWSVRLRGLPLCRSM